jgi:hypothetical protein
MQHGKPHWAAMRGRQPVIREDQAGPCGVADGLVVLTKPGNAGGGKEPWFRVDARRSMRDGGLV